MKRFYSLIILFFAMCIDSQAINENPEKLVDKSIQKQSSTIQSLQVAQEKIDQLDTESKKLTNEYKDTVVEYEILNRYDNQLQKITESQAEEISNLVKQIDSLDETNKYVLPLLERMVVTLRDLIELDVPFLLVERVSRLEELESILYQANFSTAEKFRKIYEAYQIENEYGRTIEAYSGNIDINGINLAAEYFRLGRLNLFYMTPDQNETGYWNKDTGSWVHLRGKYSNEIDSALKVAYKQAPPDFITLPVQGVQR